MVENHSVMLTTTFMPDQIPRRSNNNWKIMQEIKALRENRTDGGGSGGKGI